MDTNHLNETVNTLFSLFQEREWDKAIKLFAEDAQIIMQYGQKVTEMTRESFIQNAKHGVLSKVGKPIYLDRRVSIIGTDRFVEQHTTQLTIQGHTIKMPVCLVGKFNKSGMIVLLEEYLDPSPLIHCVKSYLIY